MNTDTLSQWLNRSALYVALLAAWIALLGSLYFSEVLGYLPCELCWYQRILMYPLSAVIAVGLIRRDPHLPYLILPFSLIGQGLSTYHYLLEKTDIFGAVTVCRSGVPCTVAWINWFGFITIPFLAMTAFFIITVFSLVALTAGEPDPETEGGRTWLPVVSVIASVILVFAIMRLLHGAPATVSANEATGVSQYQGSTPIGVPNVAVTPAGGSPEQAVGERLYAEACAACHGPDGAGVANLGNSLVESEVLRNQTPEEALAFVRQGVDLADPRNTSRLVMPASGGRPDLSDDEMLAILQYLRGRSAGDETSGN